MDEYWKEDIHKEKRMLLDEAYQVLSEMSKRKEYDRIRVPEEETEEVKQMWEKVEREDEGWEARFQKRNVIIGMANIFGTFPMILWFY